MVLNAARLVLLFATAAAQAFADLETDKGRMLLWIDVAGTLFLFVSLSLSEAVSALLEQEERSRTMAGVLLVLSVALVLLALVVQFKERRRADEWLRLSVPGLSYGIKILLLSVMFHPRALWYKVKR